MSDRELLHRTADLAADFLDTLDTRPIPARASYPAMREAFAGPLPDDAAVQAEGDVYPSHSTWDGRPAIRVSVCSWRTNERDVERTLASFRRAQRQAD